MYNIHQMGNNNGSFDELSQFKRKLKFFILAVIIYSLLILATSFTNLYSQENNGGYAETYLLRNIGARATSMAGAYTAVSNEPSAIFYNPAGIGFLASKPMVMASVANLDLGRTHSTLAYAQTINDEIGFGVALNSLNSAQFAQRNLQGNQVGTLQDWQYSFHLAAAYRKESVSIGAALKYLNHSLVGANIYATGVALDIGTKFDVLDLFTFGAAIQNVGSVMTWNQYDFEGAVSELLPYNIRTGVAMEFGFNEDYYVTRSREDGSVRQVYIPPTRYILVSVDAVMYQYDKNPNIVLGFEAVPYEMVAIRGGITLYGQNEDKTGFLPMNYWSGGLSLKPELENLPVKFNLDYSVNKEFLSTSGLTHNLSLIIEF